jgi:hypothetical protein
MGGGGVKLKNKNSPERLWEGEKRFFTSAKFIQPLTFYENIIRA